MNKKEVLKFIRKTSKDKKIKKKELAARMGVSGPTLAKMLDEDRKKTPRVDFDYIVEALDLLGFELQIVVKK